MNYYYVVSPDSEQIWSGASEWEAVENYRNAPLFSHVYATYWDGEGESAHLVGQRIQVTHLVNQAIVSGKEDNK